MNVTVTPGDVFAIVLIVVAVAVALRLDYLRQKALNAEKALENEKVKEADDAGKLRTVTETDQQATEDLAARMRGTAPPGSRQS